MEGFKKAIGDTDEIMKNARSFIAKTNGKQVYRFPEDKSKNNPRCQLCEKTCYPAEMITFNSIPFHKTCMRCVFCTKKISAAQAFSISNTAFSCQNHKNKVLQKGKKPEVSVPENASRRSQRLSRTPSNVDLTAGIEWRASGKKQVYRHPEDIEGDLRRIDPRCQKCHLTVYPAEKFTYEMIPYHRNCVRCLQCNKVLSPNNATPFGDDDFLCNNHFSRVVGDISLRSHSKSPMPSSNRKSFQKSENMKPGIEWVRSGKKQAYQYAEEAKGAVNPPCNYCSKTAYPAETITYNGIPYHALCFRCLRCGKKLNAGDANPFGDKDYLCNNHYQNIVPSIGLKTARPSTDIQTPKFEFDEHGLDPRMYVGYQWRVDKGRQSYKYPEDLKVRGKPPRCNLCGTKCYPAETITYENVPYHLKCLRCLKCQKKLSSGNATPFGEDVFLCNTHFEQYGQGAGLPSSEKQSENEMLQNVEKEVDEMAGLSKR